MAFTLPLSHRMRSSVSALAMAGCMTPLMASASPEGGAVTAGSASITNAGNDTLITQSSNRAILEWNRFDVDSSQAVRFAQPSSSSVTLNRVVGGNGVSQIDGQISANGNVFLVNPEGVMFGAGSQVNVGGLVATTADIDDNRFMAGDDRFDIGGNPNAAVVNEGSISAAIDGLVALIAPKVQNTGTITAQLGKVELAAGDTFAVDLYGDGLIALDASEAVEALSVEQQGQISANGGLVRLSMADVQHIQNGLINVDGSLQANTQGGHKGTIIIDAANQRVKANTTITAEGSTSQDGGGISIFGMEISLGGLLSADGKNGGEVTVKSDNSLSLAEDITAKGLNGNGGTINVHAGGRTIASSTSNIDASGTHAGGMATAISDGHLLTSGRYAANGGTGKGGNVDLTANSIASLSAKFEASGTDGGRIRIGGEYQGGKNLTTDELKNAQAVMLNNGTKITAKGTDGNGGTAIIWSEQNTSVQGLMDLSPSAGNTGGFVEVSSADKVAFGAEVITGQGGTFLLDPKNITIGEASGFDSDYAIFGKGYTALSKDFGVVALEANDRFATSLSLDGTRLAVGVESDDGYDNVGSNIGAVYLFSFSDTSFNGATLEGAIGKGYTGGKNIDVSALDNSDFFGISVSLDSTRLAVGAYGDDDPTNSASTSGAVYLFSFTDSSFTGGTLEATMGKGYTGGKNVDVSALEGGDLFGTSVALNGNTLAVGARGDDGPTNTTNSSGAVYLFSFTDNSFTGGTLEATMGKGYTGGKNVDVSAVEGGDLFGTSVALYGNTLAVGARGDDGPTNTTNSSGAVYLFSFTDSAFNSGTLEATLGKGYTGAKNVDVIALEGGDEFGITVSLDGNRLAVGAYNDDDSTNSSYGTGAVYLFSFNDSAFTSGTLEATIGKGYSGGKNVDVSALESNDNFGSAVSLDGTRLAVGAKGDNGSGNTASRSGAVYLFSFTDSAFTGGSLEATIGKNYGPSKDTDVSALAAQDYFGTSVSLDSTRMAVGARNDDGSDNTISNAGAVYLFTFSDSSFNGATLQGTIGKGYTGGKNVDVSTLGNSDRFGRSLSLDGNRLAVGTSDDDGPSNATSNTGAVYLFSFSDSSFTGGTLEATLGKGYTGGKNVDVSALEAGDSFGWSVSLDGNRLAVGASGDDGPSNANGGSGAVHLFSFSDSTFSGGTLEATVGKGYSGGKNVDVSGLDNYDYFGGSVSLDGTRLAVGATGDDDSANGQFNNGAVYLFSFSDSSFNTGTLQATIGKGYSGGKNIDISTLYFSDGFGGGVSLDGTRLAVGAQGDDSSGDSGADEGAVYLFTFSDSVFTGGALTATMGNGYTGGKNVDVAPLDSSDRFGRSVSLTGTSLAVGAYNDNGFGNSTSNAGAVYLFSFSDTAFTGGTLEATIGKGYGSGGPGNSNNLDVSALEASDQFGRGISLDGTRLAVGAQGDEGSGNVGTNMGAVYLFSFSDSDFNGATLEATVGKGYTGGKNIDVSTIEDQDYFGAAVSLDGNRLAVGALSDDGPSNGNGNSGAAYLFSFSDSTFTGGTLEATIGRGYTGGKNVDVSVLDNLSFFGAGISLDGNNLAVGAYGDGTFAGGSLFTGAVYLFSFSDSSFTGGTQEGIIGKGYTGGKNVDISTLDTNDLFGISVSLDGTRLAVGAYADHGSGNSATDTGAVYLFSFSDTSFTGGTLEATVGKGYTGGKNIDVSALDNTDQFGFGVSLDGTRLIVGSPGDDGSGNSNSASGAAYLFSFTDSSFSGGSLDLTIGKGYTGGSNINVTELDNSDAFGASVALNNGRLAIGSRYDGGSGNSAGQSGAAYLIANAGGDSAVTEGDAYADNAASDITITPTTITTLLDAGTNVTLQASNDITVSEAVTANNGAGDGGDFTLQAGRSILLNASITTDNGDLFIYANDTAANGVVDANRDAGNAVITMASGVTINAGTGAVSFELRNGTGNTNTGAGDITLRDITAGTIFVRNFNTGNDIVLTSGTLTASGVSDALQLVSAGDFINNVGGSVFAVASGDWLVYSTNPANDTIGGLTADFRRFTCAYGGSCPSFPSSGNGLFYSYTPTLTATPSALSITAGDSLSLVGYSYGLSGYLDSDSGDDSITGSLTGITSYTTASSAGTYNINYSSGSLTSALGYGFSYANNASAITVTGGSGGGSGGGSNVRDSLTTTQLQSIEDNQQEYIELVEADEEEEQAKTLPSKTTLVITYCEKAGDTASCSSI